MQNEKNALATSKLKHEVKRFSLILMAYYNAEQRKIFEQRLCDHLQNCTTRSAKKMLKKMYLKFKEMQSPIRSELEDLLSIRTKCSKKQRRMINGIAMDLCQYYPDDLWEEFETSRREILDEFSTKDANMLIRKMLTKLKEKQKQKCLTLWLPQKYWETSTSTNLLKVAQSVFPGESFSDVMCSGKNAKHHRIELKNRIEKFEMAKAIQEIPDDFEFHNQSAKLEEKRWKCDSRNYSEVLNEDFAPIEGIDWVSPPMSVAQRNYIFSLFDKIKPYFHNSKEWCEFEKRFDKVMENATMEDGKSIIQNMIDSLDVVKQKHKVAS